MRRLGDHPGNITDSVYRVRDELVISIVRIALRVDESIALSTHKKTSLL